MKKHGLKIIQLLLTAVLLVSGSSFSLAQTEEAPEKDLRPVRNMFESIWLIDNQTAVVPFKGTFEFDIQHRFGTVQNGLEDFFGFYAPSNIRLGFAYVPVDRLMIGFGVTKTNITWDFNAKYALIRQARSGGAPVAVTYFVNTGVDTRGQFADGSNRLSYFHQLMVARKFSDKFSMQAAGSFSHFNAVEAYITPENTVEGIRKNDVISVAFSARYKVGSWVNIIANYDQPLTDHNVAEFNPEPNISFGLELTSSSHQFQIFAGNYYNIIPQRNQVYNRNSFGDGDILIGFNITRLWNF